MTERSHLCRGRRALGAGLTLFDNLKERFATLPDEQKARPREAKLRASSRHRNRVDSAEDGQFAQCLRPRKVSGAAGEY